MDVKGVGVKDGSAGLITVPNIHTLNRKQAM